MFFLVLVCVLPIVAGYNHFCMDSDQGDNPWELGSTYVLWVGQGSTPMVHDHCSGNTLIEYYCTAAGGWSNDLLQSRSHTCLAGCSNGVCVRPACNDTIDNDGDGDIDAADGGCLDTDDNDENDCGDGVCGEGEESFCAQDCPICISHCGDGVCIENTCDAMGCPCAESAVSCPQDCETCQNLGGVCCQSDEFCPGNEILCSECTCCDSDCTECQPEICDSLDNDCDGVIDNGFDLTSNESHCGECNNICTIEEECINSVCTVCETEICDGLDNDCDGDIDNGFNFDSNPQNCGNCTTVCPGLCSNGECVYHDADEDESGDISITELGSYLDDWKSGQISITDFLDAASVWKTG